jgi:hypothetical protein
LRISRRTVAAFARTPSELKADPDIAAEMAKYVIALIPAPDVALQPAAE